MAKRTPSGTPALIALQREQVPHSVHAYDHDPAVANFGLEAAQELGVEPARVFKTLLADVDGTPVVAIVPVSGSLDLKALASARGAKRARMLEPSVAERLTGYVVGGISPLGQRTSSATVIDASALDFATVYVSAGRRGLDVELDPRDLMRLTAADLAPIAAH
ncbi:MAG: aminoacyl-tRNA deacylase [Actinomycetales bacterium mxb001]|nr:MAG: aminoacyl-tRNA deacylase [Actinomycetales bacterium mxb001]